jgi:lipopolysaccharide biosynthesis glycosyltransferase
MDSDPFNYFIGFDTRERDAYDVCAFSAQRKATIPLHIQPLKHRELRARTLFDRPWLIEGDTGIFRDQRDGRPFSTEFAFTRFLVPAIMDYKGWGLFTDCDMLWLDDIAALTREFDDSKAVMVVKQTHVPTNVIKMDNQPQRTYHRKNWSSVIAFNCGHPANRALTPKYVNTMAGSELHALSWLQDDLIGSLDPGWNFLVGHTNAKVKPRLMHFTDGGPWFDHMKNVPYAGWWQSEYDHMMRIRGKYEP